MKNKLFILKYSECSYNLEGVTNLSTQSKMNEDNQMYEKIAIGCIPKQVPLKDALVTYIRTELSLIVDDFGDGSYVDVARKVSEAVAKGDYSRGIVICRTGAGTAMAANKVPGAYAVHCRDAEEARNSRGINNSNILALNAMHEETAKEIVRVWLETPFPFEERYVPEFEKVRNME